MLHRLQKIKEALEQRYPDSQLETLTPKQVSDLKGKHPDIPTHLVRWFEVVGCGSIGPSAYMIYPLIDPTDIFGEQRGAGLDGIVLVGDDFAGTHEAYDAHNNWSFGSVGARGRFDAHTRHSDLIDFIEDWFASEKD